MSKIVDELIADGWKEVAQIMGDSNSGAQPGEVQPKLVRAWGELFPNSTAPTVYDCYLKERELRPMPLGDWLMDVAFDNGWVCNMETANSLANDVRRGVAEAKGYDKNEWQWHANQMERVEHDYLMAQDDDDDPPAMPTLDLALARLAMESPEAARAARNFLKGTSELRTVVVRFLVSERERTQIEDGMRAAGVEKISEYCRGKVLSEGQSIMRSDAYRPQS